MHHKRFVLSTLIDPLYLSSLSSVPQILAMPQQIADTLLDDPPAGTSSHLARRGPGRQSVTCGLISALLELKIDLTSVPTL